MGKQKEDKRTEGEVLRLRALDLLKAFRQLKQEEGQIQQAALRNREMQVRLDSQLALIRDVIGESEFDEVIQTEANLAGVVQPVAPKVENDGEKV